MIPYSRLKLKLSDLYTLSQSEQLENHTLHNGTYLCSPYLAVPPRGGGITGLLEFYSGFQSVRFRIPQLRQIFRNPDSTSKNFPNSGITKKINNCKNRMQKLLIRNFGAMRDFELVWFRIALWERSLAR